MIERRPTFLQTYVHKIGMAEMLLRAELIANEGARRREDDQDPDLPEPREHVRRRIRLGRRLLAQRIYEVREVSQAGMTVADLAGTGRHLLRVAGAAIPPEADEASALVAMRLLPEGELWTRTVAWYPFERSLLPQIEEAIETTRAEWEGSHLSPSGGTPKDQRWYLGAMLAELWWDEKARAHLSPQELETAKKRAFRHVTDG